MKGLFIQLILLFLYFPIKITAQICPPLLTGSKNIGIGNASVATTKDAYSLSNNPAGMVGVEHTTVIANTGWLYGIKNLNPMMVGVAIPTGSGVLGFDYQYFRFENTRYNQLEMVYSRKMASKLDIGLRLSYHNTRLEAFKPVHIFTFSIGCNYLIMKDLYIGLAAQNLSPFFYKKKLDTEFDIGGGLSVLRFGIAYTINTLVHIYFEIEKDRRLPMAIKLGLDYQIASKFTARCGLNMQQQPQFNFGFGYAFSSKIMVDMSISNHSILGLTPALSMAYFFNKKTNFVGK
jgi:hypothetical protein